MHYSKQLPGDEYSHYYLKLFRNYILTLADSKLILKFKHTISFYFYHNRRNAIKAPIIFKLC